ncbi:MAG TPA: gamma-glutamyltransferase family protein [Burkholderiales bacterium]|jgi:gamma-glutamyltranspeptidase/glutathione hydrolase|nr:gamma-glutamyltransferase family protein [Burkholderiales bacterium]
MANPTRGTRGMAVAPHSLASQSALGVLREGGNAVEAMIAAAAAITVVYPHMNGIGGDSFWLVSSPQGVSGIDACGAAAGAVTRESYAGKSAIPFRGGSAAITVAGTMSGWGAAYQLSGKMGGTLPLSRLLADAIHYADHGIAVTSSQHMNTRNKLAELKDIHGFAETFLIDGQVPATGAVFKQPRLGATLKRLADAGLDDYYRGELAEAIARDLRAAGSPVSLADLANHHAKIVTPLQMKHSLGTLYNMPPPTQGLVSLLILGQMDRLPIEKYDHLSADYVHAAVEATKRAFMIRDKHITDPARMRVDAQSFLSADKLDAMAAKIDMAKAAPWGAGRGPADTIWMGVIDGAGNAVSMIQSVYHEFGSGVVLKETGINWQNRGASFSLDPKHINTLEPGKRPFHTLNPAMALFDDGRTMVYGNMGGDGQPQSQSAVFTRTAVLGLNPQDAISAPRWLLGRTWGQTSDTLKLESRFPAATVEELKKRGHDVEIMGDFDETLGHAGCVIRHPNGNFEGGFDPRSDGGVAAF